MRILETGNPIGDDGFVTLKADLHMAQPGIGQRRKLFARQQHRRGDEIGIEPDIAGVLDQFDQILARGGFAAGEMNLQHADLGQLGKDLLPFLRRQFAAAAIQLDRIGAIGTLQWTAMRQLGEHRERDAKGLRRRAALLQRREPVMGIAGGYAGIGQRRTHDVFSRASVRNPLSARSCSMATTSVAIALRSAVYFSASRSIMTATLRTPSHSCRTSTAISSGASTRSGARITQSCRVSSNFSLACLGKTGRLASLTLMLREPAITLPLDPASWLGLFVRRLVRFGNKRAGRHMPVHVGMI